MEDYVDAVSIDNNNTQGRYANWCWTWNNPTVFDGVGDFWAGFGSQLKYGVYQVEQASTGQIHWQGYCEFKNTVAASVLQSAMPGAYHKKRIGTDKQARAYCMKEDTRLDGPFEFGVFKEAKPGKRNDLLEVKRKADAGMKLVEIWDDHFVTMVRSFKGIERYIQLKRPKRSEVTKIEVHIGETRTGKTTGVQLKYPNAYWKSADEWWDGMDGEEVVVFDEFLGWIPFHLLLRLGDGTALPVQVKGAKTEFVAKRLVIISNKLPDNWYRYQEKGLHWPALKSRLNEVWWYDVGKEPVKYDSYALFENRVSY